MNQKITRIAMALTIALLIQFSQGLNAQVIEINGFTGYALNGTARLYDGDFKIYDAQNYGGKLAFGVSTTTFLELSYMRSDTEGRFFPFLGAPGDLVKFSSNYIQVGGLQEANFGRISPFGTVAVGLVVWSPKDKQ